jgi:hypothetical protein
MTLEFFATGLTGWGAGAIAVAAVGVAGTCATAPVDPIGDTDTGAAPVDELAIIVCAVESEIPGAVDEPVMLACAPVPPLVGIAPDTGADVPNAPDGRPAGVCIIPVGAV